MEQEDPCLRRRAKVCGLAHLAGDLVLSLCVEVGYRLANEGKEQQSQTTSEQLRQTSSRILLASHLHF